MAEEYIEDYNNDAEEFDELADNIYAAQLNNRPLAVPVKFKYYNDLLNDVILQRRRLEKAKDNKLLNTLSAKTEAIIEQRRRFYDAYAKSRRQVETYLKRIDEKKEELASDFEKLYSIKKSDFDHEIGLYEINNQSFEALFALYELELFNYNERQSSTLLCTKYRKYRADQLKKIEFEIADKLFQAYREDFDANGHATDSYLRPRKGIGVIEMDKIEPFIEKVAKLNKAKAKQMSAIYDKVQDLKLKQMVADKNSREKIDNKLNDLVNEYMDNEKEYFALSQLDFLNENIAKRCRNGEKGFKAFLTNLKMSATDISLGIPPVKAKNNKIYLTDKDVEVLSDLCDIAGLKDELGQALKYLETDDDLFSGL